MEEIWKTIEAFPQYKVSNLGRVISYKNPKKPVVLKGYLSKKGYQNYHLRDINGKGYLRQAHRLVLETFSPVVGMELLEVNHKDENKLNNCLDNLEWTTHTQNVNYGTGIERSHRPQKDRILCVETGMVYESMGEVAKLFNINYGNLSMACKTGRICGDYHWKNLTKKRWRNKE